LKTRQLDLKKLEIKKMSDQGIILAELTIDAQ
jgi:hypothetical protein